MLSVSSSRSRRSFGFDFQSIDDFNRNPFGNCRQIARELKFPDFNFTPLVAHLIPKSNGKDRVICVPTVRDRIVQRAISDYLSKGDRCGLKNKVSYGFIPGQSVKLAAKQAKKVRKQFPWVYKTDIASFFDSIDREILKSAICRHVRDRSLHSLLRAACDCEIEEAQSPRAQRIAKAGIKKGLGIRQGMPLSPFFANLILKRFDQLIEEARIQMIRYADDLICFATSDQECIGIHARVREALAHDGLAVPEPGEGSKTRIFKPDESADFLGVSLRPEDGHYLLEVGHAQTNKVRQALHDLADIPMLTKANVTLAGFLQRLDGAIAGYGGAYAYCDNAEHFHKFLEGARKEAIVALFTKGLNIPVESLGPEKQRFLGILD